jgi:hypothetical protein
MAERMSAMPTRFDSNASGFGGRVNNTSGSRPTMIVSV